MADLAEVLLRMAAPMAQGDAATAAATKKQAGVERVARIGADAKTSASQMNLWTRLMAGRQKANSDLEIARLKAETELKLNPNNLDTIMMKGFTGYAKDPLNNILSTNPARIGPAAKALLRWGLPRFTADPSVSSPYFEAGVNHGIFDADTPPPSTQDVFDAIGKDPDFQKELQLHPEIQATFQQGLKLFKESQNPTQGTPLKAPEAPAAPAPMMPLHPPVKGPQKGDVIKVKGKGYMVEDLDANGKPLVDMSKPIESQNP